MKKITLLFSAAALLAACNNSSDAEKATTSETQEVKAADGSVYTLDSTTTISWTGFKPTGKHNGIFKVSEGSLLVKENVLTGGNFTIDIKSLVDHDLATDAENKSKLEGHLKSPDFFDAAKYPIAKFVITSVEPYVPDSSTTLKDATHLIKGNFTLKDSTKNISFPAKITVDGNTAAAFADFNIDRTLWGLNYKGPENPQDWIIRKEVNIKFSISATKK